MKRILKSKRGISIENAIIFMLVIFTLCALLTSLALIGRLQTKLDNTTIKNKVDIEQIVDDFIADPEKLYDYENYTYEVVGNTITIWSGTDKNQPSQLYVELDKDRNVIKWLKQKPTE